MPHSAQKAAFYKCRPKAAAVRSIKSPIPGLHAGAGFCPTQIRWQDWGLMLYKTKKSNTKVSRKSERKIISKHFSKATSPKVFALQILQHYLAKGNLTLKTNGSKSKTDTSMLKCKSNKNPVWVLKNNCSVLVIYTMLLCKTGKEFLTYKWFWTYIIPLATSLAGLFSVIVLNPEFKCWFPLFAECLIC